MNIDISLSVRQLECSTATSVSYKKVSVNTSTNNGAYNGGAWMRIFMASLVCKSRI